jgi:hypothetical protein
MGQVVLAYLDPGSGSMLLQALLGGIAGLAVAFKMFGRRILDFILPSRRRAAESARSASETDPA